MPLYLWDSKLLVVSNALAAHQDCCCVAPGCDLNCIRCGSNIYTSQECTSVWTVTVAGMTNGPSCNDCNLLNVAYGPHNLDDCFSQVGIPFPYIRPCGPFPPGVGISNLSLVAEGTSPCNLYMRFQMLSPDGQDVYWEFRQLLATDPPNPYVLPDSVVMPYWQGPDVNCSGVGATATAVLAPP